MEMTTVFQRRRDELYLPQLSADLVTNLWNTPPLEAVSSASKEPDPR
jgi:hypothetical protein